eukprot:3865404-Amphidinium_carterae.1
MATSTAVAQPSLDARLAAVDELTQDLELDGGNTTEWTQCLAKSPAWDLETFWKFGGLSQAGPFASSVVGFGRY